MAEDGPQHSGGMTGSLKVARAAVVLAVAQAGAAKVEAQHRKSERVQRLHRVIHDLVVHGAAKQRMWMAHQRGVSRLRLSLVEQRFQASRTTFKKQGAN